MTVIKLLKSVTYSFFFPNNSQKQKGCCGINANGQSSVFEGSCIYFTTDLRPPKRKTDWFVENIKQGHVK